MSIVLKWVRKDSDEILNGYEIYRSLNKGDVYTAGNLVSSISDKTKIEYIDTTALVNVPYYYGVRNKTIYGNFDAKVILLVDTTNPGYGNGVLPTVGDYEDGWIESFYRDPIVSVGVEKLIATFMTNAGLGANIKSGEYLVGITANEYNINKFWRDGKLLIVPNHSLFAVINMSAKLIADNIITPIIATNPVVEVEGGPCKLNFFTRTEAAKYYLGGAYGADTQLTNHFIQRVIPKTFSTTSVGGRLLSIAHLLDVPSNSNGAIVTNGTAITNTTASYDGYPLFIPWYLTPIG